MPMKSTVYNIPIRFLLDLDDKLIHIWIRKPKNPKLTVLEPFPAKKILNFDYFSWQEPWTFWIQCN